MSFYTYLHARPDTVDVSGVFYVGKGCGKRATDWYRRNIHHDRIVRKYGASNILIGKLPCSNEATSFELERGLIKCLRQMGVSLANMTDGGEGAAGFTASELTRQKMSEAAKILHNTPKVKASKSAIMKEQNKVRWSDPAYREHAISGMRGKKKTLSVAAVKQRRDAALKSVEARKSGITAL